MNKKRLHNQFELIPCCDYIGASDPKQCKRISASCHHITIAFNFYHLATLVSTHTSTHSEQQQQQQLSATLITCTPVRLHMKKTHTYTHTFRHIYISNGITHVQLIVYWIQYSCQQKYMMRVPISF